MTSLINEQASFVRALADVELALPASITTRKGAEPVRRFNVYRNNVYAALIGVLEARFPAVMRLVGEEFFKAMARVYVGASPPVTPVLIEYGAGFADFIDSFEPVATEPYLGDVARLEWSMHQAFHAADCAGLTAQDLGMVDQDRISQLRMTFIPAVSLLASPYPVFSVWRANRPGAEDVAQDQEFSGAEAVLVTRPSLTAEAMLLPAGGAAFVRALMAGRDLAIAAEAALTEAPEFPVYQIIAALIKQRAIAAVYLD